MIGRILGRYRVGSTHASVYAHASTVSTRTTVSVLPLLLRSHYHSIGSTIRLASVRNCQRTSSPRVAMAMMSIRHVHHQSRLRISDTVQQALDEGRPVVALESTIITHGMSYPHNLETALEVEAIVRQHGCVPATIALLNGQVRVGLDNAELKQLAKVGLAATKTSRRDMALVLGKGLPGSTTVSGTMIAAHKAGIKVFVTGGIGGVHRGSESTMDISADLTELGRTPIAVISAGVKSILDIGRTLEYLETQGVTVVSYGDSDDFPAFYTRKSGFKSMAKLETPEECAQIIHANTTLGLDSGIVIAVPIPEKDAFPYPDRLEQVIQSAVSEAVQLGVRGKEITPFLLDKVTTLTEGTSLKANISLIKNNAAVGSDIAHALALLSASESGKTIGKKHPSVRSSTSSTIKTNPPLIIGGTVCDITAKFDGSTQENELLRTSTPGTVFQLLGGVGRNVAEACQRSGGSPYFLSAIGDDEIGKHALSTLKTSGLSIEDVEIVKGGSTATYSSVMHHNGELLAAVADMKIHDHIAKNVRINDYIRQKSPSVVCMDANSPESVFEDVINSIKNTSIVLCFEPTSIIKSRKLFNLSPDLFTQVQVVTPNRDELFSMSDALDKVISSNESFKDFQAPQNSDLITKSITNLLRAFKMVVVKCGADGVVIGRRIRQNKSSDLPYEILYLKPTRQLNEVVSVTGAGDSMVGTIISGLSSLPLPLNLEDVKSSEIVRIVRAGMKAAEFSLQSKDAVSPLITLDLLKSTD
ncbi:hypothetical protein BSLG_000352 [Batrachochytrium salamandrivorans]|nr:hypothetical protein BASA60_002937 [Batrachochytrium salamandrivorans]KAJ1344837.1 hypothetical protein BSLG_000352 [Batrachochytrium salamandrivorans]